MIHPVALYIIAFLFVGSVLVAVKLVKSAARDWRDDDETLET